MIWIIALIVWTSDGIPNGRIKPIESESACWTEARQETPRVRQLYPGQRFKWLCVKVDDAEVAEPKGES
jgi:hypothetical protein